MDQQPSAAPPPDTTESAAAPPAAPQSTQPPAAPQSTQPPAAPDATQGTTTQVPPATEVQPPYWQTAPDDPGPAPGVEWAGYGARLAAYIIDALLLGVVILLLSLVLVPIAAGSSSDGEVSGMGAAVIATYAGIIILVSILYFPYFWQRTGATPGMRVFGIRVVRDRDGGPVTWGPALLRWIGYSINSIVFGIPIGFLWIFFDKRRRGWHDLIGGTVVIKG